MIPDQPRRYELKLVCDARYLDQARSWMRLHPAGLRVAYPPRRVNSLYFDTPGLGGLETNLQGVEYATNSGCVGTATPCQKCWPCSN